MDGDTSRELTRS